MKFIENGVEELKLKYQGSKAYLSQAQRREIINYLDSQVYLSLQEFREYQDFLSWRSEKTNRILSCSAIRDRRQPRFRAKLKPKPQPARHALASPNAIAFMPGWDGPSE